ncbi:hypothetical protein DSC47_13040 [Elizabethkingia miricola]|uniref:hypothetical protein n=1 Tax=Elizabethkingia bruuniana TaxID=1756149 RepID=UPI000999B935|nr:hypothetical protein [Elizabethkingia bruuniana]OPC57016.1 hypothetical protein BAY07_08525 [Elizabethkingia bruuniana]OPC59731.1 hypothetical protein BAY13_12590 [Elizabethkingia bruuniana]RBI90369.1 hypothetical protein DSC47_13040 [Elizabethkingia miricola]
MIAYTQQSKVIIFCPPQKVTGGPEALHQLSDKLLRLGNRNVFMSYIPKKKNAKPQSYSVYNTQEIDTIEDNQENILIIPESMTFLVKKYPKSQKIIWWLSVDFYKILMDLRIRRQNIFSKLFYQQKDREYNFEQLPNVFQWAQSYRSSIYIKDHKIPEDQIDYVCDYINPIFLKNNKEIQKDITNRTILYNPQKGKKEISELIKNSPELVWIPIQNMSAHQIKDLMAKSLLYVDFGENPGRDKMLRESVSQDCCIISGKNGSSLYYEDLMIPDEYKFNFSKKNIPHIIEKIKEVLEKYSEHIPKFVPYKEMVLNEEISFEEKLKEIFKK